MAKKDLISRSEFARRCLVTPGAVTQAARTILLPACSGKQIDANHPAAKKYTNRQDDAQTTELAPGVDPLYAEAVEFCSNHKKPTSNAIRMYFKIGGARADSIFNMIKTTGVLERSDPAAVIAKRPRVVSGQAKKRHTKKSEALQHLEQGNTLHQVPEDIEKFVDMTLREIIQRFGSDYAFTDWLKATKAIEEINEKRLKNAATRGDLVSRVLVKIGIIDPIDAAHIKLLTDGAKTIARRATAMHDSGRPMGDIEKFVTEQITSFIRPVKVKVARALRDA